MSLYSSHRQADGAPSPLAGEGGFDAKHRNRVRGCPGLRPECVAPTPHPNEFLVGFCVALSRKGRGRSHWHRTGTVAVLSSPPALAHAGTEIDAGPLADICRPRLRARPAHALEQMH